MAREGLSYDEVARVAIELRAQGAKVSTRAVLAQTGGSASTVHKHLRQWWNDHPEPTAAPAELPLALQRALQDELRRIEAAARADAECRLVTAEQEAEDLAKEAERLQDENSEVKQQLVDLTAERDRLQGQARQQAAELERVQAQLEQERRAAEGARVDLAQARLKVEAQGELVTQVRGELTTLRTTIEIERTGRIDAERLHAAATAARDTLHNQVQLLIKQGQSIEAERDRLQQLVDTERTQRAEAQRALASSQAEGKAAAARAEDLARREKDLQEELQQHRKDAGRESKRDRTEK